MHSIIALRITGIECSNEFVFVNYSLIFRQITFTNVKMKNYIFILILCLQATEKMKYESDIIHYRESLIA